MRNPSDRVAIQGRHCLNLARFAGFAAALATWAMLYLLAIDEIPTFMSEPTGMWIGVFGLGLLLDGFFRGAPAPLALGLGTLLLGFMARPGPLLILPAIFLAALCLLRTSGRAANWDSYGYVSRPFCIPDRNWTFLATLGREYPPGFFNIESLVPVDAKGTPLLENAPLPYHCLDGNAVTRF